MKSRTRTIGLTVALCIVAVAAAFAADPNLGTWKLNEAKSTFAAGAPKNSTVMYETAGDSVKVTIDGTDSQGKPAHNEWTGKFDGKEYAVTGDPTSDMRSYTRVDANTLAFNLLNGGKVTTTGRVEIAGNGMTRTVTTHSTDAMGKKLTSTAVFDKQ